MIKKRIFLVLLFLFAPLLHFGLQPPGNGNGGGNGGGPGNGNGNDPCTNPNPPPSCNNVPIDDDIWILLISGAIGGGYFIQRRSKYNPNLPTIQ